MEYTQMHLVSGSNQLPCHMLNVNGRGNINMYIY